MIQLIAARAGSLFNLADVARGAQLPRSTAHNHFRLLRAVFLVVPDPAQRQCPRSAVGIVVAKRVAVPWDQLQHAEHLGLVGEGLVRQRGDLLHGHVVRSRRGTPTELPQPLHDQGLEDMVETHAFSGSSPVRSVRSARASIRRYPSGPLAVVNHAIPQHSYPHRQCPPERREYAQRVRTSDNDRRLALIGRSVLVE